MLNDIYKAIKSHLIEADEDSILKGIEWYNVQYESTIASTPRIFVEFPNPLVFDRVSKDMKRTAFKVRLHVVTQALSGTDGAIPDTMVDAHETAANFALNTLKRFVPQAAGEDLTTPFDFTLWQHWHKYRGWMVTFVEFDAKKVL